MVVAEPDDRPLVLILGAGINGCSVARELVLNGIGVWVVDLNDIAFGATSKSSRLIHGGLRYLEYGDFHLVRESLEERKRLVKLAPHLVQPLRLYIPVTRTIGGWFQSASRFLGVARSPLLDWLTRPLRRPSPRGLWIVEIGLWLYDRLAADALMPKHSMHDPAEPNVPHVDSQRYRWLFAYSDAQMRYPERYCVALLEDARQIAEQMRVEFRVLTYAKTSLAQGTARIATQGSPDVSAECTPSVIVNATGAWGDLTLGELRIPAPRLLGGTKGSHFITYQPALKAALGDAGVYAEADDGRLVFVLPFGAAVLVGTTDERFDESPERAVATDHEIDYLVGMVNELFPQIGLSRADVTLTYSGVRPLPYSAGGPEGAISRDHSIAVQQADGLPVLTLVGGKLTTSRALGEQVTDDILQRLRMTRTAMTVGRFLPGGRALPPDAGALDPFGKDVPLGLDAIQVQVLTQLCGNRFAEILERHPPTEEDRKRGNRLTDTLLPRSFVRWVIDHEWVARIEDLVERRLMLLYEKNLSMRTLEDLADLLIEAGKLRAADRNSALVTARQRLQTVYGRTLTE